MTREARLMSGIILITVPTIQYGGYFLLTQWHTPSCLQACSTNYFHPGESTTARPRGGLRKRLCLRRWGPTISFAPWERRRFAQKKAAKGEVKEVE
jgi:hypothetical protein